MRRGEEEEEVEESRGLRYLLTAVATSEVDCLLVGL